MRFIPSRPRPFLPRSPAACARGGLGLIAASLLGACAPERDCSVVLWWVGEADSVAVAGDWNGWSVEADLLEPYTDEEGQAGHRLQIELEPGEYAYQFVVDGAYHNDPFQPLLSWDPWTQEETSLLRVEDCSEPSLELEVAETTADGSLRVEATFLRAAGGARLDPDSVQARLIDGTLLGGTAWPSSGLVEIRTDGLAPGKHVVQVSAADRDGARAALRVPLWVEDQPFSWDDAVIYQVITDRFASIDGQLPAHAPEDVGARLGGDLPGLTRVIKSGYFDDLGVNVLWLSPVYENPEGWWVGLDGEMYQAYHGYWPVSETAIEPAIGSADDLDTMLEAAHARGIRVLLDVVPNHVHTEHPWFTEHGQDWFHQEPDCVCGNYDCPWSSDIETCWFTEYLPDLALEDPLVLDAVMESTVAWAKRHDFDGFRVDAVPMMPRSAVRDLVWRLQRAFPGETGFYTLGETYTGEDYGAIRVNLGPFGLGGQFEFPVMWALRDWVAWESGDAATLEETIATSEASWEGSGAVMAPFVGNHDMTRFLSEAAGSDTSSPWDAPPEHPDDGEPFAKLLMAQALVMSLPGAPVIYYGDEYGLPGAGDPDCRRPMHFDLDANQAWTLERMQRLGQGRACSVALRRGERRPLLADGPLYAHARDADDGLPAITLLNASGDERSLRIELPADVETSTATFVDLVEGETFTLGADRTLDATLPAWSARVLIPDSLSCPGAW